ncbi:hypothetical protein H4S14_001954 [Agrobacterium vitis]|nr:hypothetical protein [Agrobacterium vitis]MBE1438209.1 hypothetical protein [Agrobacterium vitis]
MKTVITFALLFTVGMMRPASAEVKTADAYCNADSGVSSLRQTMVIIDGNVAQPDGPDGPSPANTRWRKFAAQFFDARNPTIGQIMAPRERVTIAIANSDGSGLTPLFTGCIPTVSKEEAAKLDLNTSNMQKFIGSDWRSKAKDSAEDFSRTATISLVQGLKSAKVGAAQNRAEFSAGGLVQSLNRAKPYSLANGLPRVVIYSDLSKYHLSVADSATAHAKGRADGETTSLDLQRAELNIFSTGSAVDDASANYLRAFFLMSKAKVETIGGEGGMVGSNGVPVRVAVYQGAITLGGNPYPVRMRLATDQNGTVTMSWIEEQSDRTRFVPFSGILNCTDGSNCEYVGDRVFAQVWADTPGTSPSCEGWMPFGGLRDFSFTTRGDSLTGKISDAICVIVGEDDGLKFNLKQVQNASF